GCSTYRLETFAGMAEETGLGCAALTWPHSNGQTWVVLGDRWTLSRLPPALRDPAVSTGVAELFAPVFGDRNAIPWETRLSQSRNELLEAIPPAAGFVLVDEDQWGIGPELAGRRRFQFPERDGHYGGPPADDRAAIDELARLRRLGATHIVIGWPAYWWLHQYLGLHSHLRSDHRCILENERLIVFELRG
ncbi:MAG: glycosyl transferase family 2, partial [Armatimonadetes bacterium]|nr:glycosyl transferase family 2 [Armatimonadota bacterium]